MSRRKRRSTEEVTEPVMLLAPEFLDAAPVEQPAEPTEEAPEAEAPAAPPAPVLPKVPLEVFATAGGARWDQLAGFVSHAKRNKLGPMSIKDWRAALVEFQNKPVG